MRILFSLLAAAGMLAATAAGACEYTKAKTASAGAADKPVASAPMTPKPGG